MNSHFTVVYDACVLYPAPLRDLLMRLALTDMFRARWSNQIHDEWIESVLRDRPDLRREALEKTRTLMNSNVRDCLVTGYEHLIPSIHLPDPRDRHVGAAAIHCGANLIVMAISRTFPTRSFLPISSKRSTRTTSFTTNSTSRRRQSCRLLLISAGRCEILLSLSMIS